MGFKTRKKNKISKIIVEVDEEKHILFKTLCTSQSKTMKAVIEPFIDEYISTHSSRLKKSI